MFLTEGEYVEEATRVSKMFDLLHEHHPQAVSYVESLA